MKINTIPLEIALLFVLSIFLSPAQLSGQSALDIQLHETIQNGNLQACISLTKKGANINEVVEGNAPLHLAVSLHQNEIAKYLIKKGAKIDKNNKAGESPLLTSMEYNNPEMGLYLIDHGADIQTKLENKQTLLHTAVCTNSPQILEVLLKKGLDPNALDKTNTSPLELTFYNGSVEMALTLLKYGASPMFSIDSFPILILAMDEYESEKLANAILINGADPNTKDPEGMIAYDYALRYNYFSTAKLLLEKGADISNSQERSILLEVLDNVKDDVEKDSILINLIQAGVNPNLSHKNVPLLYLVFEDNYLSTELRTLMLEKCEVETITQDFLDKALAFAINFREKDLAIILISKGANASAESEYGYQAYLRAIWMGDIDFLKLLLENGAIVKDDNSNGAAGIIEVIAVLAELGIRDSSSPTYLNPGYFEDLDPEKVKAYPIEALQLLIEYGANINGKDPTGNTPLHAARQFHLKQMEELLIEMGAIDE